MNAASVLPNRISMPSADALNLVFSDHFVIQSFRFQNSRNLS